MADKKGRRNRPADRHATARSTPPERVESPAVAPPVPVARTRAAAPLPSANARMSGFVVALVTAFLAILLIRDALTNAEGAEVVVRAIAGALLILLAIVVAVLVLFPEKLQAYFARRR